MECKHCPSLFLQEDPEVARFMSIARNELQMSSENDSRHFEQKVTRTIIASSNGHR